MGPRALVLLAAAAALHAQSVSFQWIQQIGGSQGQAIVGVAADSQGNVYTAGTTTSVDLPVKSAVQASAGNSGLLRIDGPGAQWRNLYSPLLPNVGSLSLDPIRPGRLYATNSNSAYRSLDGGATWSPLGPFSFRANSVTADPVTPGVLYVAALAQGVYKSADDGVTFAPANLGIPDAYRIWIDPRQPVAFAASNGGLARTTDAAANWQTNTAFIGADSVVDLAFDASTPGRIYAATVTHVQVSSDEGVTWSTLPVPKAAYFYPTNIVVNAGTLYVSSNPGGIYRSADGGQTWSNQFPQSVYHLAVDPASGNLYAAGAFATILMSTDGFATTTPVGPSIPAVTALLLAGGHLFVGASTAADVYVAKYDPLGNLLWSTYFGGAGNDEARALAIDSSGAIYVTGTTSSSDFPVTLGAYLTKGSAFLFKLNADGSLAWSTCFTGGTPNAIAVDVSGRAFLAGTAGAGLPTTPGAYQTTFQAVTAVCCNILGPPLPQPTNAFVTAFDPAGASLALSTYLGKQDANALSLALSPDGSAVLAGSSTLYHLSADGSSLIAQQTVNGTTWGLAVDSTGNIYATGLTLGNFPATPGAYYAMAPNPPPLAGTLGNTGAGEAFVTRFDPKFNILATAIFGGEAQDEALSVSLDARGNVIVAGSTYSRGYPLRGSAQGPFATGTGFITELTPDLSAAVFSTYAGDTRPFNVRGVAPTPDGGFVFAGAAGSGAPYYFPGSIAGGDVDNLYPTTPSFQSFVVKAALAPTVPRIDAVLSAASQLGMPLSPGALIQVQGANFADDATLLVNGSPIPLVAQTATSLTAALPADLPADSAATLVVQSGSGRSNPFLAAVARAAPAVFSANGSGVGQGLIFNQDGTLNTPSNPAQAGSPITICATGVGPLTIDQGYAVTASPVDVFIDGIYADGIAAILGPVAGLPGNVYQISVFVPKPNFTMPNLVAVTLRVNGVASQAGLAISVVQ